jgi:hypothetical protein
MAAKTRKSSKKKDDDKNRLVADSPITVGGGGGRKVRGKRVPFFMELFFNHVDYFPDPEEPNHFINPNLTLSSILINAAPPVTNAGALIPITADSEIVIKYRKGAGNKNKILINSGPFGVNFKASHLPYEYGMNKHQAAGLEITKIIIDGTVARLPARPVTIEVHTV